MYTYPPIQLLTVIFWGFSVWLQSCMPPQKLVSDPSANRGEHEQELFQSPEEKAKPTLIPTAYLKKGLETAEPDVDYFRAASGEVVTFFQEDGFWKGKVQNPWLGLSAASYMPVFCEQSRELLPILQSRSQQGADLHKNRIHILNRDQNKCVFVGFLGLKGGTRLKEGPEPLALVEAVAKRNWELVKKGLELGLDPNIADDNGGSPLYVAAELGYLEMVRLLLENGAKVNAKTNNAQRCTALHMAVSGGHVEVAKLLLAKGADPNSTDIKGYTPLHMAIYSNCLVLANLLLEAGAKFNVINQANLPFSMQLAIWQGYVAIIELLLDRGIDPNRPFADGSGPLHWAAYGGSLKIAELLLKKGADPNFGNQDGFNALQLAMKQRHVAIIALLLDYGMDPNRPFLDGSSALHWAVYDGYSELVDLLLEKGADPNVRNEDGITPLQLAIEQDCEEIIRLLLAHGIDPHRPFVNGLTPLHLAAYYGYLNVVDLLLERDADPNASNKDGFTPLHLVIAYHPWTVAEVVKLLLEKGANPNVHNKDGITPFQLAIECGYWRGIIKVVKLLLKGGANPNVHNKDGITPFQLAIECGYVQIIRLLLDHGIDPNTSLAGGLTPLHWAAYYGYLRLVNLLLERGADPNADNEDEVTPLHLVIGRHPEKVIKIVELLLKRGANPNASNADGVTPLHCAIECGYWRRSIKVVKLLLERGADPNAFNKAGFTPLHFAIKQDYVQIMRLLLDRGMNPNLSLGSPPLHWAAYEGSLEAVDLLLKKGADPNITDSQGYTPLHKAASKGRMHIIRRLLLDNLVDINAQDYYGNTFLYILVNSDNDDFVGSNTKRCLYMFLSAMQHIETMQHASLNNLVEVMQDYCPELTNKDTQSILAMAVDYIQGIDLGLDNQDGNSVLKVIEEKLVEEPNLQNSKELGKVLDKHQKLGGWMACHTEQARKL